MRSFLAKRQRPTRIVRLHTVGPEGKADLTFEGVLVDVIATPAGKHYVLERPQTLDTTQGVSEAAKGVVYEVPVERVWFREILAEDASL